MLYLRPTFWFLDSAPWTKRNQWATGPAPSLQQLAQQVCWPSLPAPPSLGVTKAGFSKLHLWIYPSHYHCQASFLNLSQWIIHVHSLLHMDSRVLKSKAFWKIFEDVCHSLMSYSQRLSQLFVSTQHGCSFGWMHSCNSFIAAGEQAQKGLYFYILEWCNHPNDYLHLAASLEILCSGPLLVSTSKAIHTNHTVPQQSPVHNQLCKNAI